MGNKAYKVVITGAFNAGKTEFVRSASAVPIVSTDRKVTDERADVKETTTVAMDYGQATVDGCLLHLYGTPGQERFDFMWDILAREMDGFLVLVDSTDRTSLTVARRILRHFKRRRRTKWLVVATKQDLRGAMSLEEVARRLRVPAANGVVACDPRKRARTHGVLKQLCGFLA